MVSLYGKFIHVYTTYTLMVMTGGRLITFLPTLMDIKLWFIPSIPHIFMGKLWGYDWLH